MNARLEMALLRELAGNDDTSHRVVDAFEAMAREIAALRREFDELKRLSDEMTARWQRLEDAHHH